MSSRNRQLPIVSKLEPYPEALDAEGFALEVSPWQGQAFAAG